MQNKMAVTQHLLESTARHIFLGVDFTLTSMYRRCPGTVDCTVKPSSFFVSFLARSPSPSVKSGQTTGLVGTPVERKTSQLREREHDLIVKIVRLVNKRDAILSDLHSEQIRAADEQRQMDREYQKWRGGLVNEDWRCASWQTTTEAVDTTFPEWSRLFLVPPPKKPQNKTLSTLRSIKRRVAKALGNITAKRKNK